MSSILKLHDISIFTPDGQPLASKISFEVSVGEVVVIDGENGSGKTTLIKSILGLYPHFAGQIERAFSKASYLPQLGNVQFFLPLTILDVIQITVPEADLVSILNLGLLRDEDSVLRSWNTASGGEKQKALLTRVFLQKSELLVLDEPFNHLDHRTRQRVVDLIHQAESNKTSVILISHERVAEFESSKQVHVEGKKNAV